MEHQSITRWKEARTIDERLVDIRKQAASLVRSFAKRQQAIRASMNAPGFVVSSGGPHSRPRNGAHNTAQKRLQDARDACRDDMDELLAMVTCVNKEI